MSSPPPPGGFFSSLGISAIRASLVKQQRRDAGGVLQGAADHLGRVDDAFLDHVAVRAQAGVVAVVAGLVFETLLATTSPFSPALSTIWMSGDLQARTTML